MKEDGAIAYVEDGEVEINEPIAFNMEQEKLALQGTHNLYNSLAAGISANLAGIEKEYIRRALSDFKGVEHRLEKVATVRGVEFINDSKATNVNSCWYALQSMKTVIWKIRILKFLYSVAFLYQVSRGIFRVPGLQFLYSRCLYLFRPVSGPFSFSCSAKHTSRNLRW